MSSQPTPTNSIDIALDTMILTVQTDDKITASYPISYAKNGIGSEEGSGKTPLGRHTVCEKIGVNAPLGTVFKSRVATGAIWHEGDEAPENLITTRILRLQGEEAGINKGPGVDSYTRYIYIHGTNHEEALGKECVSFGCILMANKDITELFDMIDEGTHVSIHR